MRRLPFALAHIEPFVLGGTAPIDAVCCLARDERAKLPEGLASSRAPASMDAMHDACGGFFRACAEAWKTPRQFKRMVLVTAPGAAFTFSRSRTFAIGQPDCAASWATRSLTLRPSARAAKVSAMRCLSTGTASARHRRGKARAARRGGRGRGSRASRPAPRGGQDPRRYAGLS